MFEDDPENEPPADGRQFDVVGKFREPQPGDVGPDVPAAPDPTDPDVEVDARVRALFWSLVVVVKLALLATSLGLLMIGFDRYPTMGWRLLAAGLVLFAYAAYRYRHSKRKLAEIAGDDGDDAAATEGTDPDPNG